MSVQRYFILLFLAIRQNWLLTFKNTNRFRSKLRLRFVGRRPFRSRFATFRKSYALFIQYKYALTFLT